MTNGRHWRRFGLTQLWLSGLLTGTGAMALASGLGRGDGGMLAVGCSQLALAVLTIAVALQNLRLAANSSE